MCLFETSFPIYIHISYTYMPIGMVHQVIVNFWTGNRERKSYKWKNMFFQFFRNSNSKLLMNNYELGLDWNIDHWKTNTYKNRDTVPLYREPALIPNIKESMYFYFGSYFTFHNLRSIFFTVNCRGEIEHEWKM